MKTLLGVTTEVADNQLEECIASATMIVDNHLRAAGYPDALVTRIELNVAAHYAVTQIDKIRQVTEEKFGDASAKFSLGESTHFESSTFGQAALQLDYKGFLAQTGMTKAQAWFA